MTRNFSIIVDGEWQSLEVHDANAREVKVNGSTSEVDQIVSLLSQVVRMAQSLSEQDAYRVRAFFQAAQSMLTATTYLPKSDQKIFETALRDVARKKFG
jgi:hypothetical protein